MPQPQSPFAQDIANLYTLILVIASGIFLLVTGLVLYMIVRFRDRGQGGDPRPHFGDRRLEIAWTAAPALILVVVLALTLPTMASETPDPPAPAQYPFLQVTGHQFWWEVVYPQAGVRTANEIHIPTGQRLLVELHSADVIHDFWVPELGPKMDMVPGQANYLWLQADHPGMYQGECAEFCGAEHAWMRFQVVAEPQATWEAWAAAQRGPALPVTTAPTTAGPNLAQGAQVFAARTCISCHAIGGMAGATAAVGPDLTHFGSRHTIAAGVLANTPENLRRWLADPQAVKPGSLMPNVRLSPDELDALTAYLESLK